MNIFEWFKPNTKYKRWLVIVIVGIILICNAIAQLIILNVIDPFSVLKIIIEFIIGVLVSIFGIIGIQKRTLEIYIESQAPKSLKGNNININSLIFDKKIYENGPKVVLIGGGAGTNEIIKGLKNYTSNITVLATLSNDVERVNSSRNRLHLLPLQSIKESIATLSEEEEVMRKLLNHNFTSTELNGLNFGDIYLLAMQEIFSNTSVAIKKSTEVLNIQGEVVPVSLDPITVFAELTDGTVVKGKNEIPRAVMTKLEAIQRVFIEPNNSRPTPRVLEAIREADIIVVGPGNMYTDIIPTFLVKEVVKEIKDSKAMKVYVANIMTDEGQTDGYKLSEHIKAINDHARENIFDFCIADTGEITPEYLRLHHKKGADVVEIDMQEIKKLGTRVIKRDLSKIIDGKIRHNSDTIALTLMEIVLTELKYSENSEILGTTVLESVLKKHRKNEKKKAKILQKAKKVLENSSDDDDKSTEDIVVEEILRRRKKQIDENIKKIERDEKGKSKFAEKYTDRIKTIREVDNKKDETNMIKNFFKQDENENVSNVIENIATKIYDGVNDPVSTALDNSYTSDESKFNTISIHRLIDQINGLEDDKSKLNENKGNSNLTKVEIQKHLEEENLIRQEIERKKRELERIKQLKLEKQRKEALEKQLELKKIEMESKVKEESEKSKTVKAKSTKKVVESNSSEKPKTKKLTKKQKEKETAKILLEELRKLDDFRLNR